MISGASGAVQSPLLSLGIGSFPGESAESVDRRLRALKQFKEGGLPTGKNEAWKYTRISYLAQLPFQKAEISELDSSLKADLKNDEDIRLVFVNGVFIETISNVRSVESGITVTTFQKANELSKELLSMTGILADLKQGGFAALNQAAFEDGALIYVAKGENIKKAVRLIFISQGESNPIIVFPKVVMIVDEGASVTLCEEYRGNSDSAILSCPVTEIRLKSNASLFFYKIQEESHSTTHFASTFVEQSEGSHFESRYFSFGGATVRNEILVKLAGKKASCVLNGLFVAKGSQHMDNYTFIDHKVSDCTSNQLYKGIVDEKALGVFFGRIRVEDGAMKTDAKQTNKNLILSDSASINSRPQLEIYADDVKCSHGAAIGQIDENSLFYLKSRGIGPLEARRILTFAFASEMAFEIKDPSLQSYISTKVNSLFEQERESLQW